MEIIQPIAEAFVNGAALLVLVFTAMLFTVLMAGYVSALMDVQ